MKPEQWRALAVREARTCDVLVDDLRRNLESDAGQRTIAGIINEIRATLKVIDDAQRRDGRWPGYAPTDDPRNAPWKVRP